MKTQLLHGDCLERFKELPDNSVDAVVTDPPYGLSFMGKKWDYDVPSEDIWRECLRVLKPGGHLLAFAGTRTQHRMAVRIEDAGFEIRDMIAWVYGSGFPKSLDVSKAIDKAAGAEREVVVQRPNAVPSYRNSNKGQNGFTNDGRNAANWDNYKSRETQPVTAPATDAARQWQGWGTALKPALEPVTVARKPLVGTVAANVLEYGTGALNIDGGRVGTETIGTHYAPKGTFAGGEAGRGSDTSTYKEHEGRWPANLIHDGSDEVVGLFPVTTSGKPMNKMHTDPGRNVASGASEGGQYYHTGFGDTGSAARFFYCAKASKRDRDEGLEGFQAKSKRGPMTDSNWSGNERFDGAALPTARNHHPTVKPTALMRYLCRLVTPPGGTVLDPFMGSGSTGKAAMLEGFQFIGIEREAEYLEIAKARIEHAAKSVDPQLDMPGMV